MISDEANSKMEADNPSFEPGEFQGKAVEPSTSSEDTKVHVSSHVTAPQPRSKNLEKGFVAGLRKFGRQTVALTSKNLKLSLRNQSATIAQLWIGVLFLFLILIIGAAIEASSRNDTSFVDTKTHVDVNPPASFPPCNPGANRTTCYAFAYGSSRLGGSRDDAAVDALIDKVAESLNISNARNVPGGIYSFGPSVNSSGIEKWILDNPNTTRGVLIFENSYQWTSDPNSAFRYIYRYNDTRNCREIRIYKCDEPWLDYHFPLISAVNSAFNSLYGGDANSRISVSFSNFPHPDMPAAFDAMQSFGTLFIYIALTFNYVILLTTIVREKELHLVESMRQMGMMNSAYWMSWIISATIINTLMVFLIMLFGVILQFELFLETDGQLLLTILWLTAQAFTAVALFFSSFIRTTANARVIGVMVFIITFIAAPLLYAAYYQDPSEDFNAPRWAIAIFPFFSFYHALQTVIDKSSGSLNNGMSWSDRTENLLPPSATNLNPTYWSVDSSLSWLAASFFYFIALAWYIEQIVPNEFGRSKYPWFILDPRYWGFKVSCRGKVKQSAQEKSPTFTSETDDDVKEEALAIYNGTYSPAPAVVLRGVLKTFGSRSNPFVAVNRVFYGMNYGELTAILGHNGSGKSTTFNMLTGLMNVSGGDADIFGRSITGDMAELHASMGVCPQHDVLWDQLTAREHLELFARIKGLDNDIKVESRTRLEQVKLVSAADSRTGKFSGGMRRRLSIAIAMLGDPAIVFLDEPTTGMDPVTRREVLEMISESKKSDRVIVLTSHAMEEVEMLADKIVVMSRGSIQAIGTTLRLKKKFGLGYTMTMFGTTAAKITEYVAPYASLGEFKISSDPKDGAVYVNLPRKAEGASLIPFFQSFEGDKEKLGVTDYSLSLSTLEEVFLNLSKSEEDREAEKRFRSPAIKKRYDECENYKPEFRERTSVSIYAQVNALFWNNLTFQLKNLSSCCGTILFPVIIMILLIVLDRAIFLPEKVKAVCGKDISAEDCPSLGPDLDCLGNLAQFRPITTPNSLTIGNIDLLGNRGQPINANCDNDICFENLEKMDSRDFPVSFDNDDAGFANFTYNSALAAQLHDWHTDLLFLIDSGDRNCTKTYDDVFSVDSCPKSPPSARQDCIDDRRLLTEALDYLEAQQQQTSTSFGLGACLRSNTTGQLRQPDQAYLDRAISAKNELTTCKLANQATYLMPHFLRFDLDSAIGATIKTSSGFMQHFGLSRFLNTDLKKLNKDLWDTVNQLGPLYWGGASAYYVIVGTWLDSIGVNPADYQFIPTVDQICDGAPFAPQLDAITNNNAQLRSNICAVFKNLDAVRGFSTANFDKNREALDNNIYSRWFGKEEQTTFMRTQALTMLQGEERYRERQYHVPVSGLHFRRVTQAELDVVIYHNRTAGSNARTVNWVPLVANAQAAFVKRGTNRDVHMRTQQMASKFKCNRDEWLKNTNADLECDILPPILQLSIIDFVAAQLFPFLFFVYAFLIVNQIVYEKEQRLRVIMRMNGGLKNSVYWVVSFFFFYAQFIIMALLIYILGNVARLRFTAFHDAGVYWAFAITWGALLVVFSFLMSIFFSSSQSSTAGVFLFVLVINLVGIQLLVNLIQDPYADESSYASLMWLPPFVMIRYVVWMGLAGGLGSQIRASELSTFADGALALCLGVMWAQFVVCIILVWYLDNVYVAGFGTGKHPLFFLNKKYWTGERLGNEKPLKEFEIPESVRPLLTTTEQDDVNAEYERVVDETTTGLVVRVVRLHKEFENGYVAVKSLSLGINENECFGLLGHNGAGKTTAISMLVGLFEPTSGTALVDGLSINNDMDAVQTRMGVCPQHDVCWGPLSVRDHLLFYARLKGVPFSEVSLAVDKALFDVNLKQFEHRAAQKLSGGMRRRLSTAMSLIGTPRVVYLDEPSTGLDPASKRALWNVIAKAKGNKSLVLTTHSMEEAEALCDRIGIMALGEMQCLGTAAQLKARYGTGYTFFLAVKPTLSDSDVLQFVDSLFGSGNAKILGRGIGGTYKFEVARHAVVLSAVFSQLESPATRERMSILDWSLTETTLEEVFLKLADLAHVDEALSAKPKEAKSAWTKFRELFQRKPAPTQPQSAPKIEVQDKV